jgi:chromate transport protein ChrA
MSTEIYAELFALCQCMPGPASTQLSFSIGIIKRGVPGAGRAELVCEHGSFAFVQVPTGTPVF